jgi:hypothetical protein
MVVATSVPPGVGAFNELLRNFKIAGVYLAKAPYAQTILTPPSISYFMVLIQSGWATKAPWQPIDNLS